jgi:hypothetical protein
MTAYPVENEVRLIDDLGADIAVISGSTVSSTQGAIIFAGIDGQNKVAFPKIDSGSLNVIVNEPSLSELNFYAENITGSCYFMAVDLSNVSGSYRHDAALLSGIKITSLKGYSERTHILDKWRIKLGVILSATTSSVNVSWLGPGTQAFLDANSLVTNAIDISKNIVDLTVQSGSLQKIANNYIESLFDLTSQTSMVDVEGQIVNVEPGDLVLRVQRLANQGGSLTLHYHMWYQTKD